jgi:hypothetical protein
MGRERPRHPAPKASPAPPTRSLTWAPLVGVAASEGALEKRDEIRVRFATGTCARCPDIVARVVRERTTHCMGENRGAVLPDARRSDRHCSGAQAVPQGFPPSRRRCAALIHGLPSRWSGQLAERRRSRRHIRATARALARWKPNVSRRRCPRARPSASAATRGSWSAAGGRAHPPARPASVRLQGQ